MRHALLLMVLVVVAGCGLVPRGDRLPPGHVWRGDLSRVSQHNGPAQVPVAVARDGRYILTTDDQHAGLYLTDTRTSATLTINREWNAGYYPGFSPDGRFVFFKTFRARAEGYDQAAMSYDIRRKETSSLSGWVRHAGTPTATDDGLIAWVADDTLYLRSEQSGDFHIRGDGNRIPLAPHQLGSTPNVIELSPDGNKVAYPNADDQIEVLYLVTGERRVVTDGKFAYWGPRFSHFGNRMLARTINDKIVGIDLATLENRVLGTGEDPLWLDNDRFVFVEWEGGVRSASFHDGATSVKKMGRIGIRWWALSGRFIASQKGDNVWLHEIGESRVRDIDGYLRAPSEDPPIVEPTEWPREMREDGSRVAKRLVDLPDSREIVGVPYLNQVWDLPDGYPGEWACNASSAVMCLAYHGAVPPRPIDVTRPAPRRSNFGHYVTEPYTVAGHTFDTGSPGPDKKPVRGGYGYIVRDEWKDTKHYMRDYFRLHGLESKTDWEPSFAKAQREIDAMNPLVVLHSITLAGHYVTCIGYDKGGRRTLVVNDPYGNKNTREYPTIDGRRARYDLPGSNNGFQNLRIVHCFITTGKANSGE